MPHPIVSRLLEILEQPATEVALAILAFLDGFAIVFPPEFLLYPAVYARPAQAGFLAFVATAGSVLGALAAYYIGQLMFETFGQMILEFYGMEDAFVAFTQSQAQNGATAVLLAAGLFMPMKAVAVASGVIGVPVSLFTLYVAIARAIRFGLGALLVRLIAGLTGRPA